MNKKWYLLIFKQEQPIHIGIGSYGVLSETRLYIPGWTIWGVLTNSFGMENNWNSDDFKNEGNRNLFKSVSCFYPYVLGIKDNIESSRLELGSFPYFKNGLYYINEKYNEEEFRMEFADTYMSTSIEPYDSSAKEESLHEMEVILPQSKLDFDKRGQIFWIGILDIDEDNRNLCDFLNNGRNIWVGGDQRYGLGKLKLVKKLICKDEMLKVWNLDQSGRLKADNNMKLNNYLEISNDMILKCGRIEGIIEEFEYGGKRAVKAGQFRICCIPGSCVDDDKNEYLLERGILKKIER